MRYVTSFVFAGVIVALFISGCFGGNVTDRVDEESLIGAWKATYNSCGANLPVSLREDDDPLIGPIDLTGTESITFYADKTYVQMIDLVQDDKISLDISIHSEWFLDDEKRIHLLDAAWPAAGLEHARDFSTPVLLWDPNKTRYYNPFVEYPQMSNADVVLTMDPRVPSLYHAISTMQDIDGGGCGTFHKQK